MLLLLLLAIGCPIIVVVVKVLNMSEESVPIQWAEVSSHKGKSEINNQYVIISVFYFHGNKCSINVVIFLDNVLGRGKETFLETGKDMELNKRSKIIWNFPNLAHFLFSFSQIGIINVVQMAITNVLVINLGKRKLARKVLIQIYIISLKSNKRIKYF